MKSEEPPLAPAALVETALPGEGAVLTLGPNAARVTPKGVGVAVGCRALRLEQRERDGIEHVGDLARVGVGGREVVAGAGISGAVVGGAAPPAVWVARALGAPALAAIGGHWAT